MRLYAAAIDRAFILMDDNAHLYSSVIVDDYLKREGYRVIGITRP